MKDWCCIRLDPEQRLCSGYDSCSVHKYGASDRETMGMCVLDDFPEEHIQ